MHSKRSRVLWCWAGAIWSIAAAGVWVWATQHEYTTYDAVASQPAQAWPVDTNLQLAKDRPTLLLFMHPRCPCTRASLRQLERILARNSLAEDQQPHLIIAASIPENASLQWRDSDTLRSALALPRAQVAWDVGGREARRFGVVSSGAVRLYNKDGRLVFQGGVTVSRGHDGDNVGSDRLLATLREPASIAERPESIPVFGCRLCIDEELAGKLEAPNARPVATLGAAKGVAL
jgi:hypothetical protein